MSTKPNTTSTSVQQVEVDDLNDLFEGSGADAVLTPSASSKKDKPSFFSKGTDLSFLDPGGDDEEETDDEDVSQETPAGTESAKGETGTDILDDLTKEPEETEDTKTGRPKTDKSGLVSFFKKQIESGRMQTFDDFDDTKQTLDEYLGGLSQKDLDELWELNDQEVGNKTREEVTQEFFESLPQELQYAAKYALDGGTDMKGLFRALSHVEETRDLDPEDENDQIQIMRQYLSAKDLGDDDEIEAQINEWKDLGTLANKAKQFKPKLDQMQEEILKRQLADQEHFKVEQQKARDAYVNNVFGVLKAGELNGIKLDKTTQQALYTGLTQPNYKSMSGRQTNQLGHLLEKYQYGQEANYGLIAEALFLLSNPDAYRESLRKQGAQTKTEQVVRTLKTEQQRKKSTTVIEEKESTPGRKGLARPVNIFKR
jgi:hypothetical protein